MTAYAWYTGRGWLVEIVDRGLPLFTRTVKTHAAARALAQEYGAALRTFSY
jgi:hypothetical protein